MSGKPLALRVIVADADEATAIKGGDVVEGKVSVKGGFKDYITENLTPPAQALYVALIYVDGSIDVLLGKGGSYTPAIPHTFAGWPVP